jgi:uncharacterized membrane protein
MNRKELDAFVEHHQLSAGNVDLALTLAGARPTPTETHGFATRLLMLAGVVSFGAGIVFFIAANWDVLRVAGRFALLELLMLASLVLALWRPPPKSLGRYALLTAFVTTGALLALFGQTYQTGADVYELFLTWTALALPFVLAGQWSVLWGAWVLVLNVALGLFCGFRPDGGPLWILFSGFDLTTSALLLIAALVNLALWALAELASDRMPHLLAGHTPPRWLRRFVLTCAVFFTTWAGCLALVGREEHESGGLWVAAILAAIGLHTARRRADVFPLALISASLIAIVTALIASTNRYGEHGAMSIALMLAFWLIFSSTVSGRILMHLVQKWRTV